MALMKEFKEFALKGNVIDLAVGVVIGAAFGKIVDSLVNDILMPLLGIVRQVETPSMRDCLSPIPIVAKRCRFCGVAA